MIMLFLLFNISTMTPHRLDACSFLDNGSIRLFFYSWWTIHNPKNGFEEKRKINLISIFIFLRFFQEPSVPGSI